jgi:hypothetical protein
VPGTTGRPAEVLRKGSGIKVDAIGAHVLGRRDSPLAKDLPCLIYHRRALSNELLIRAVTGTSFFPIRGLKGAVGCYHSRKLSDSVLMLES